MSREQRESESVASVRKAFTDGRTYLYTQTGYIVCNIADLLVAYDDCRAQLAAAERERKVIMENGDMHPFWRTATREELLGALGFQGAMTNVLLKETDELRAQLAAAIARYENLDAEWSKKFDVQYERAYQAEAREALRTRDEAALSPLNQTNNEPG